MQGPEAFKNGIRNNISCSFFGLLTFLSRQPLAVRGRSPNTRIYWTLVAYPVLVAPHFASLRGRGPHRHREAGVPRPGEGERHARGAPRRHAEGLRWRPHGDTWDVTKRGYAKSERLSPINYCQKLSAPGVCLDVSLACGGLGPPAPPGQCGQRTSCVRRLGSGGGPRPACN